MSRLVMPAAAMVAGLIAAGLPAQAAVLSPTAIEILVPENGNNPGPSGVVTPSGATVYVDDIYLQSLTFGGGTYTDETDFRAAAAFEVLSNRGNISPEWGDRDDGADGDGTPFSRIGQPDSLRETTDPEIQDAALREVFNSRSLTEMTDGEGGRQSFKVGFDRAIIDNDDAADDLPEIVIFERGRNDSFAIELIIGGDFADPILSDPLSIASKGFADLGLRVNTREIGRAQSLGVGGFDLSDWNIAPGQEVLGYVLTRERGGPDLGRIFATGLEPLSTVLNNRDVVATPLPPAALLLAGALLGLGALRRRRG